MIVTTIGVIGLASISFGVGYMKGHFNAQDKYEDTDQKAKKEFYQLMKHLAR